MTRKEGRGLVLLVVTLVVFVALTVASAQPRRVFRYAGENFERLPVLADELVRAKVDIIMTASTPPAVAAKRATTTIPIITISADPIGANLVASLADPPHRDAGSG